MNLPAAHAKAKPGQTPRLQGAQVGQQSRGLIGCRCYAPGQSAERAGLDSLHPALARDALKPFIKLDGELKDPDRRRSVRLRPGVAADMPSCRAYQPFAPSAIRLGEPANVSEDRALRPRASCPSWAEQA
jgi:hypothetical protein